MNLRYIFIFACCCMYFNTIAQQVKQAAWQQRVSYIIVASLNTDSNTISAQVSISYQNNSPDTLHEMYIHVWPNAYRNTQTAFARQQAMQGKTTFWDAEESERGWIDSLNFTVNSEPCTWHYTEDIDIVKITLKQPILPGNSVRIATPFIVKLPRIFSRLGVENEMYCITQWYPKPAVYDVNGWNPMPYLDQGEFYSEFGSFDVTLTVPKQLVLAATGNLQQTEEKEWWKARALKPGLNHPSTSAFKTLHFTQDSIHDFAWFASAKFSISYGEVYRRNKTIESWLFAPVADTSILRSGVNYINNAIRFYSDYVGEYPYNHATVVVTPLKAGGGMEYPTITNCGSIDETTIVHEVGHNWFYGIIGSNERAHPWMDESINTYYETRSQSSKRLMPRYASLYTTLKQSKGDFSIDSLFSPFEITDLLYQIQATKGLDQKGTLTSEQYTGANYGSIIYAKIPKTFYYLQAYLGDSLFDAMMQSYFQRWKFRHPLPGDFKEHAESITGKNLEWFFSLMLDSTVKQDIHLSKVKKTASVYNLLIKQTIDAPYTITGMRNGSVIESQWQDTSGWIVFPNKDFDQIRIDAEGYSMDIYRNNNTYNTKGLMRYWNATRIKLLADLNSPHENRVMLAPIMGANLYNKFMLGIAAYNSLMPIKRTEYILAPMYAFGTKDLAGYAELKHNWLLEGNVSRLTLGIQTSRFATANDFIDFNSPTVYERINPFLRLELRNQSPHSGMAEYVDVSYTMVHEQTFTKSVYSGFLTKHHGFANVSYTKSLKSAFSPYSFKAAYQLGNLDYVFQKLSIEGSYRFSYGKPQKGFTVRGFGGVFLQKPDASGTGTELFRAGNQSGIFDYTYSQSQFGRSELSPFSNSLFANQLLLGETQFHIVGFSSSTDSWVASTNLRTTLPGKIPLQLYADIVALNEARFIVNTSQTDYTPKLYYTGGVCLYVFDDILQIHVPLFASQEIINFWENRDIKLYQRINFSINLNRLQPIKLFQSINLF